MATRQLTTNVREALDDAVVYPFYTVNLFFDEGTVRLWTGSGELNVANITYTGVGTLLGISSVEETADLSARGVEITLSGIPSSLLSLALSSSYQARKCQLGFGLFTTDEMLTEAASLGSPFYILQEDGSKIQLELAFGEITNIFTGYMDKMDIIESGETSTISLKVENKLITLERPRDARYNSGFQNSIYPNDRGLDYVEDLQDKKFNWGPKQNEG
jgi:hypothetical protein